MRISSIYTKYPRAIHPSKVGSYSAHTKSGAGMFYDDVLEYRVWIHPKNKDVCFWAFKTYNEAKRFSNNVKNKKIPVNIDGQMQYIEDPRLVEDPLVLVSQNEWVDEPKAGQYVHMQPHEPRITEWQVQWLKGKKGTKKQIPKFIARHV